MLAANEEVYWRARRVLLDALEASVIVVGAQAIYLHTGEGDLNVGPVGFLALAAGDGSDFHTLFQQGNGSDRFHYKKGGFTPDGKDLIVFRCSNSCGVFQGPPARSELVALHRDGSGMKVLARLADDTDPTRISVAPDGSAVTYSAYAGSGSAIYVVDISNGRVRTLVRGDDPDWGQWVIERLCDTLLLAQRTAGHCGAPRANSNPRAAESGDVGGGVEGKPHRGRRNRTALRLRRLRSHGVRAGGHGAEWRKR